MRVTCCKKMIETISNDELMCILDQVPFTKLKAEPTVHIISDGGHGGEEPIKFCPFCGKKIEIA